MNLSPSAVESLFHLGRFREIVSAIENNRTDLSRFESMEHATLVAEAMARTGRLDQAKRLVTEVSQRQAEPRLRARCELILGLVARDSGHFDEGLQKFQMCARIAKECRDNKSAALASLLAFRVISERQPPSAAASMLADVRSLVTRAGDPHLTVYLHESVARHEAQLGNFDEARRHLRIATGLLERHPNVWLEQLCAVNGFCIEFSSSNLRKAESHLKQANALSDSSGSLEPVIANNTAHLQIQLGHFSNAESLLKRIAEHSMGEVLQSTLDGLGRLYLATGRLEDCERALNSLSALVETAALTPSFPFRSSLITRARLLVRQSNWREAARVAEVAIEEAKAVNDGNTLVVALFLRAQADYREGRLLSAANSLATAARSGAWANREHQGMFSQLCSEMVASKNNDLAARLARRAKRVWREQGNVSAESEFQTPASSMDSRNSEPSISCTANSLAIVFDVAYNPRLLGAELQDVIKIVGCSPDVKLVERGRKQNQEPPYGFDCLSLGEHGGDTWWLLCKVPDDPVKAILLSDILRIGRAALALERAREDERSRAALWPADPVEEQGDAIFLAEEMQALLATARRIAPTNVPILITGETGTGKEVLARTIHACSSRAAATFLPFNCASTPRDMLDSQLFGHRRGAFTGAVDHFPGVIRAAAGGTLFLDEIGDVSLDVQPKLLRFLEASEVHPIGETQPSRVDVRVIVATNVDLETLVSDGRFREDLFYRLSIVRLHLPPLRERRVEIPTIANHYLRKYAQEYRKGDLRLSEDTMEYVTLYRWPGNVRQLANEMRRLAALAETGAVLMPEHLKPEIAASRRTVPASQRVLEPTEVVVRLDQPMAAAVRHLEQTMVQYALRKCGGRVEETAAMLGLSRKGLYLKRQRFGIDPPEPAVAAV